MAIERKENDTFSGGLNCQFNATVGHNGSGTAEGEPRSNIDYVNGFSSATLKLIDVAIESQEVYLSLDYLIYPICFNMRHAVELQLKKVWKDLEDLSVYRQVVLTDHRDEKIRLDPSKRGKLEPFPAIEEASTHDLSKIWTLIEEYAPLIDRRFVKFIKLLTPFISDIAAIDPTGQTFRYPACNTSQVHLVDTPIINIKILKVRFTNLIEILRYLEDTSEQMKYEYSWATITKNLSHFDLIQCAHHFASFIDCGTPYPIAAKESTQSTYSIGSNEYSKVVKIVSKNKAINNVIGNDNLPDYLDFDSICTLLDQLDKVYSIGEYREQHTKEPTWSVFDFSSFSGEDMMKEMTIKRDAIKDLSTTLSKEQIAEIFALYEFYKQHCYFEIFQKLLEENIGELTSYKKKDQEQDYIDFIYHFFEKTNLLKNMLSSMYMLNMKVLVNQIVEKYQLSEVRWYKKLISGVIKEGLSEYCQFNSKIEKLNEITNECRAAIKVMRLPR